jgi:transcriptional regulator with XRE-family HTH domain
MDAFDRILDRTSKETQRQVGKNLAIANRIIEILKSQDKSQRDLAQLLNKSESEISKWLTGLHNFEIRTIYKIENALGEDVIQVIDSNSIAA